MLPKMPDKHSVMGRLRAAKARAVVASMARGMAEMEGDKRQDGEVGLER